MCCGCRIKILASFIRAEGCFCFWGVCFVDLFRVGGLDCSRIGLFWVSGFYLVGDHYLFFFFWFFLLIGVGFGFSLFGFSFCVVGLFCCFLLFLCIFGCFFLLFCVVLFFLGFGV